MPRVWKPLAAAATLLAALLIVAVLAADRAVAQEQTGTTGTTGAVGDTTAAATPGPAVTTLAGTRHKHSHLLAASAHGGWRVPVRILKEDKRNINDIMSSTVGFDAGLRCYLLDGLALGARYARGGLDMTANAPDLARFRDITGDEYLTLDSYTVWLSAYLGNALLPDSRYNPYLTLAVSRYDWAFTHGGRGGEPYVILETPVEGQDMGLAGGIGCEYALGDRLWLETEWSWNYVFTGLARSDNDFNVWTNTHYWNLGLGLVLGF